MTSQNQRSRKSLKLFVLFFVPVLIAGFGYQSDGIVLSQFQQKLGLAVDLKSKNRMSHARSEIQNLLERPPQVYFRKSELLNLTDQARMELAAMDWESGQTEFLAKIIEPISTEPSRSKANQLMKELDDKKNLIKADQLASNGEWAEAEHLYLQHLGLNKISLPHRLSFHKILTRQGRNKEARKVYQDGIFSLEHPEDGLASLWVMDVQEPSVGDWEKSINDASALSPNDPRVALARAFLARSSGKFSTASEILTRLETQFPEDLAVRQELLQLSIAQNQSNKAAEYAIGLTFEQSDALQLASWFAQAIGNTDAEQKYLKQLIELVPTDRKALSRLSELALSRNQPGVSSQYQSTKSDAEMTYINYSRQCRQSSPLNAEKAKQLAASAKRLGLEFDTWAWSSLSEMNKLDPAKASSPVKRPLSDWFGKSFLADLQKSTDQVIPETFASKAKVQFEEVAQASGLSTFAHLNQSSFTNLVPPLSSSGGLAIIDFDNDGHEDLFALQSGVFPPPANSPKSFDRLFRNTGTGEFIDVTEKSGIDKLPGGFGHGVAVGDVDNDGFRDLFITRWRGYTLLRNKGDGTFEDITAQSGLSGERDWPTSAAFADFDNDGDLDLYVCHYMEWIEGKTYSCIDPSKPNTYDCRPRDFPAMQDHLFRNDSGRFVDVSQESGIASADSEGRGLGVVAADVNNDGLMDLFVANDTTANFLFINQGGLKFEESAFTSGVAANGQGGFQAGMGVAATDFNSDGQIDLAVTNFFNESTSLFQNLGSGIFADRTAALGVSAASRFRLGFGIIFADFDNNSLPDFITANGHVTDSRPAIPWRMPLQLFLNRQTGKASGIQPTKLSGLVIQTFEDFSNSSGPVFQRDLLARGLVSSDLNHDGKVDVVVQSQNDPLLYLKNTTETAQNWVELDLIGIRSNRDGIGAKLELTVGNRHLTAWKFGGGSFQSATSGRIHMGLADAKMLTKLTVTWPSGAIDQFDNLEPNKIYRLVEGSQQISTMSLVPSLKPNH